MPNVLKAANVRVYYQLQCCFERATALADDLYKQLKDQGVTEAEDVTIGWDRHAQIMIGFSSLAVAVKLDAKVRELLARKVNYTYKAECHTSYGRSGPEGFVTSSTSIN